MESFVLYCMIFVGVVNFGELSHKIYKNKDEIKKYVVYKYNECKFR